MTHEELLAKIAIPNEFIGVKYAPDWQSAALRAVVELHKANPEPENSPFKDHCRACGKAYPCKTIQVIEKELK